MKRFATFLIATTLAAAQGEIRFESLSIKPVQPGLSFSMNTAPTPAGFVSTLSLFQLIMIAYYSSDTTTWTGTQLLNTPAWIGDFYNINARVSQTDLKAWQSQSRDHELLRSALRAALADRWHLAVHEKPAEGRIFELVLAQNGPRLKPAAPDATPPPGAKLPSGGIAVGKGDRGDAGWELHNATMQDLAWELSIVSPGAPVRDRTGITGRYDFLLPRAPISPDEDHVYTYSLDRLGLKVKPGKESRPLLVIDHIERPTPN